MIDGYFTNLKLLLVLGVATMIVALTACYYKGGVDDSALARVTNSCDVPIAVSVGSHVDSYPPDRETSLMCVIDPEDQQDIGNILDYPPGKALYVWVVVPGAEQRGDPYEIPIAEVGEAVTSAGARIYLIDVSGDMCPSP